jgi:hypothetical protein
MVTHIWSSSSSLNFLCYFKRNSFCFNDILQTLDPGILIEFRTIGGYDVYNTYIEHCIIVHDYENNKLPSQKDMTEPFKIFKQKWYPQHLIEYLKTISFQITRFSFETDNQIFCQNYNRLSCLGFTIHIPHAEKNNFLKNLNSIDATIASFLQASEQFQQSFLIYKDEELKIILPQVENVELFIEHELLQLSEMFI